MREEKAANRAEMGTPGKDHCDGADLVQVARTRNLAISGVAYDRALSEKPTRPCL